MSASLPHIAKRYGVHLIVAESLECDDALGTLGASIFAQACSRGVITVGLAPEHAYCVCHEMAHYLRGFDDERAVLALHKEMANALVEPWRTRALPDRVVDPTVEWRTHTSREGSAHAFTRGRPRSVCGLDRASTRNLREDDHRCRSCEHSLWRRRP